VRENEEKTALLGKKEAGTVVKEGRFAGSERWKENDAWLSHKGDLFLSPGVWRGEGIFCWGGSGGRFAAKGRPGITGKNGRKRTDCLNQKSRGSKMEDQGGK